METKILKYLLFILIFLSVISCNEDVQNVKLEGYVYEKETGKPLSDVKLAIENAYYEGGDFDSYNHFDNDTIQTDREGYYSINFSKSAYVQIEALKEGYSDLFKDKYVHKNKVRVDFHLEKE